MFHLLTLTLQVLLRQYRIVDKASCRAVLHELVSLVQTHASESGLPLDDVALRHIKFTLNNDAVFGYVYRLIAGQFQTEEILFEMADEDAIAELAEDVAAHTAETIDPVLIVSLVSQIVSIINAIKTIRNR